MKVLSQIENEKGGKERIFFLKVELISLSNNKEFIIFWSRGVKQGST
jgi:hypothetical protein